jgi:hypothetical protein
MPFGYRNAGFSELPLICASTFIPFTFYIEPGINDMIECGDRDQ